MIRAVRHNRLPLPGGPGVGAISRKKLCACGISVKTAAERDITMSKTEEIARLIEQLYAMDRVITAMAEPRHRRYEKRRRPHLGGASSFSFALSRFV